MFFSCKGSPADLVNVRMQNDNKLPVHLRRNYKNCFDALFTIFKTEGIKGLFKGTQLVTIGNGRLTHFFTKSLILNKAQQWQVLVVF